MDVSVEFKWNPRTKRGLQTIPSTMLYTIARETLDISESTSIIPKDTGRMRTTSMAGGVRNSGLNEYYIGSFTDYASYVWNMPSSTNWTTPGSNNKWYARTLKKHGQTIINNAINQSWKREM